MVLGSVDFESMLWSIWHVPDIGDKKWSNYFKVGSCTKLIQL